MKYKIFLIVFLELICLNKINADDYMLFEPYIASNGWREADRGLTELYLRDSKKALREFERSDSLGYPLGSYYLSYVLETCGDKEKSIEFLKKSAQKYCFLATILKDSRKLCLGLIKENTKRT